MVIDTSALVAILTNEPEQADFIGVIERANLRLLSAASWVEVSIVIESRYGAAGLHHLDRLLARAEVEPWPSTRSKHALRAKHSSATAKGGILQP